MQAEQESQKFRANVESVLRDQLGMAKEETTQKLGVIPQELISSSTERLCYGGPSGSPAGSYMVGLKELSRMILKSNNVQTGIYTRPPTLGTITTKEQQKKNPKCTVQCILPETI